MKVCLISNIYFLNCAWRVVYFTGELSTSPIGLVLKLDERGRQIKIWNNDTQLEVAIAVTESLDNRLLLNCNESKAKVTTTGSVFILGDSVPRFENIIIIKRKASFSNGYIAASDPGAKILITVMQRCCENEVDNIIQRFISTTAGDLINPGGESIEMIAIYRKILLILLQMHKEKYLLFSELCALYAAVFYTDPNTAMIKHVISNILKDNIYKRLHSETAQFFGNSIVANLRLGLHFPSRNSATLTGFSGKKDIVAKTMQFKSNGRRLFLENTNIRAGKIKNKILPKIVNRFNK